MKKPFEVDERVRVYATLNGAIAETKGTVARKRPDEMLFVNLDGRRGEIVAHPKQCRRLVKKFRRRIYVPINAEVMDMVSFSSFWKFLEMMPAESERHEFIEFVEVKKK